MSYRQFLISLFLVASACGDNQPEPAAQPAPELWTARPLIADGSPVVTGEGILSAGVVFERSPTYESCTSPTPGSCLTWTAALPPPPPGATLQISPIVPLWSVTGYPVTVTPEGQPPCNEPLQAITLVGFGPAPRLQGLTAEPITVPPGTDRLSVAVCFFGAVRAQVGDLSGSMSFVRWQPLHR